MVNVWVVEMAVDQCSVNMRMDVRFRAIPCKAVFTLVMLTVDM